MKGKLVAIFLLIVLMPLALLGWLGARVVHDEQEMVRHRFDELLRGKLQDIDAQVRSLMLDRERELLQLTEEIPLSTENLRGLVRSHSLVHQVLLLDPEGELLHPPLGGPLSARERDFLRRTRAVWTGESRLYTVPQPDEYSRTATSHNGWGVKSNDYTRATGSRHGWYVWYWEEGINFIFWQRNESQLTLGIEVDRIQLLSYIVGQLPGTDPADPNPRDGSIALSDSSGRIVYRWGGYNPPEGEAHHVQIPLSRPLASWRLSYYVPGDYLDSALAGTARFTLLSGIGAVGLALAGLAVYFYRESSRQMREATQRVSFVNQVSHELKTPLTNIRMYAELLEKDLPDDAPGAHRHLKVVVTESQRLSRLIANVLTFARKQRRALSLHRTQACVDEIIASVLEQFRPSMESKGIGVDFSPNAPGLVSVDADAVGQILANLFSNAEKYAASGKAMSVASRQEDTLTTITVSDRGPGIPERERERIFEPFRRLGNRITDGAAGTGIGMAIARDLARLHGGDLVLAPAVEGATFILTLHTPPAPGGKEEKQPS